MTILQPQLSAVRLASQAVALAPAADKTRALNHMAAEIRAALGDILVANEKDLAAAKTLSASMQDRLKLTPERVEAIAKGVEAVAALPDPVGNILAQRATHPARFWSPWRDRDYL
jgi:glutamate-5-semialdehyde dehydrogenase